MYVYTYIYIYMYICIFARARLGPPTDLPVREAAGSRPEAADVNVM